MSTPMSPLEMLGWVVLCAVFIGLAALFSGSETGLYCVNRLRLRVAAHEKHRRAGRLQKLLTDQAGLLSTTLIGTNLTNYLAPVCLTTVFLSLLHAHPEVERERLAEFYTTLILTPLVFIFGEAVPKNLFQRHADRLMPLVSSFLGFSRRLFQCTGIISLQKRLADYIARRLQQGPPPESAFASRHSLYHMLREGAAAGALSHTQAFILERLHVLQAVRVGAVMVPRSKVAMLPAEARRPEVEARLQATNVSRLPIFRHDSQWVIGVAHVLDLLAAPPHATAAESMRPPLELAPELPVIDALTTLQQKHHRMAIVVDRWGHCVGMVTVKDLVEEIVGELAAW